MGKYGIDQQQQQQLPVQLYYSYETKIQKYN